MSDLIASQPKFSFPQVIDFVQDHYGMPVNLRSLESERDQNFLATDSDGQRFVVRIANHRVDPRFLDLENLALLRLAESAIADRVPSLVMSGKGEPMAWVSDGAERFPIRMVGFIEGELLAGVRPQADGLLCQLGGLLGSLTATLSTLDHPASRREFHWDLDQVSSTLSQYREFAGDFDLLNVFLERYQGRVLPRKESLRKSIIHNDANDHNVIVNAKSEPVRRVNGIIDFGDMVFSSTVNELAIAMAYAMLGKTDPLASAAALARGFHQQFALTDDELTIVFDLACMRLCTSVVMAGYQRSLNPENEYLSVTDRPARTLLSRLAEIHPNWAASRLRVACGKSGSPVSERVITWLKENRSHAFPILGKEMTAKDVEVLDLSAASALPVAGDLGREHPEQLFELIRDTGKSIGVGRYLEPRTCYQGEQFAREPVMEKEPRTIHMGMDLFVPAGQRLFAPLDGIVHSFADNAIPFDYGPTVLLKHGTDTGDFFFTLYGHLSRESLDDLQVGQPIQKGTPFARVGTDAENGGWPAHLHFQIMTCDLGHRGNFPGVVAAGEMETWKVILPDANLLLNIPDECFGTLDGDEDPVARSSKVLRRRQDCLNPSLSLSYDAPLHMVRGRGAFLFDHQGVGYLDCVNNVCHLGHCHPRVTSAASQQLGLLNTNTRYLHENIVEYAERLTATLPERLDVCYFVNSGSEANDLALRIAGNFTGRNEVLCIEGAYHGNLSSLVDVSPYKFDSPGGKGKPSHVHMLPLPDGYRGIHRQRAFDGDLGRFYARFAVDLMKERSGLGLDQGIAAFICESILSCGGQVVLPEGYLDLIYREARQQGVVCIADEVQVGFGRVGEAFWGFELQDVVPDIVTMGKPIGNGFPLGAVVTTRELADAFNNGMEYFNTFGGNPVACAVGNAVLEVIHEEKLTEQARYVGDYFLDELNRLKERFCTIGDVRGKGLFLGIEFVKDPVGRVPNPSLARYLVERMKQMKILLSTDGPQKNVIKIKPPLAFSRENVDQVVASLEKVMEEDFPLSFESRVRSGVRVQPES